VTRITGTLREDQHTFIIVYITLLFLE